MRLIKYLSLVLILAIAPGAARANSVLVGDLNNDNKVDIRDAEVALRIAVGLSADQSGLTLTNAPISRNNSKGNVTINDAVAILRLAVGLDTSAKYDGSASGTSGGPTVPVPVQPDTVRLSLETPRGTYGIGDDIPFTARLINGTKDDVTITSSDTCEVDLTVSDASGAGVWHPTEICGDVVIPYTVKAGEEKDWNFTWSGDPKNLRAKGSYSAKATLNGADYAASVVFNVTSDGTVTVPPYEGPATFDLTPGRGLHFVNTNAKRSDETIQFLRYAKTNGQYYAIVSQTPDSLLNASLRLDDNGNLIQLTDGTESVRLKLNANVGDTWTFDNGSQAKVTMTSRNAKWKTTYGEYDNLLQYDFFVGPDNSWTEYIDPSKGIWVGYSRETIAGPFDYALVATDGIGIAISSDSTYAATLYPGTAYIKPGETFQFNLLVTDKTGVFLKDYPGTVTWSVDPAVGTIDQNGLFTARTDVTEASGSVKATIALTDSSTVTASGMVTVSVNPQSVITPTPPSSASPSLTLSPIYAALKPGAQQQYAVSFIDSSGAALKYENAKWGVDPSVGTIDQNGLLTAANVTAGVWGAITFEATYNGQTYSTGAKVYVGSDADTVGATLPGGTGTSPASPPGPILSLAPIYAALKPGAQLQYAVTFVDASGAAVKYENAKWGVDSTVGTIDQNGLLTAANVTTGVWGAVTFEATYNGQTYSMAAKVYVGSDADSVASTLPVVPDYSIQFSPFPYAYVQPGAQQQFTATVQDKNGKTVAAQIAWSLEANANYGTIAADGLFTASQTLGASGPVYATATLEDGTSIKSYTKVMVGDAPTVELDPTGTTTSSQTTRMAFLEGGSLKLSLAPFASALPVVQADIAGSMPDPSWSYSTTTIDVEGDVIILTPMLVQTTTNPVVALIAPFTAKVYIKGLIAGKTYTVIAAGMDAKLTQQITL